MQSVAIGYLKEVRIALNLDWLTTKIGSLKPTNSDLQATNCNGLSVCLNTAIKQFQLYYSITQ